MGLGGPSAPVGAAGLDKKIKAKEAQRKADQEKLRKDAEKKKPKTIAVKGGEQKQEHVQTDAERALVAKNLRGQIMPKYTPPDPRDRLQDLGLAQNVTDEAYKMNPELLGQSARGGVQADAGSIAAQQRAMDELFGIYDQGGATAQDRAREAQARANSDQYIRGQREAHQQDLGERGMYGSGAEIGMLLGDRQNAATTMAQSDLDTQAMHEQRAMDALMKGGDMAGTMRDTSFQEGSDRALGQDEFAVLRNNTVNQAKQGNVDFLREQKNQLEKNKFDAWEGDKNRAARAAEGIMGEDAAQNKAGWGQGLGIASQDVGARNGANASFVNDVTAGRGIAGDNYAVGNDEVAAKLGVGQAQEAGVKQYGSGAGQFGDSIVGAEAGSASGGAIDFTGGTYDPNGKKKRP